jgi:uncharacterized membrane protein
MLKPKAGSFALSAGVFATMLWGSQAWVAVRAMPQLNFVEITLLLHVFALAGVTALNLFRLHDFVRDIKFILHVRPAFGFWALSAHARAFVSCSYTCRCRTGPRCPA